MCIGSGIGSFEDVYDMSVTYEKGVSPAHPPTGFLKLSLTETSWDWIGI